MLPWIIWFKCLSERFVVGGTVKFSSWSLQFGRADCTVGCLIMLTEWKDGHCQPPGGSNRNIWWPLQPNSRMPHTRISSPRSQTQWKESDCRSGTVGLQRWSQVRMSSFKTRPKYGKNRPAHVIRIQTHFVTWCYNTATVQWFPKCFTGKHPY